MIEERNFICVFKLVFYIIKIDFHTREHSETRVGGFSEITFLIRL